MSELIWCEECKSRHTVEFGEEFHGRILRSRLEVQIGDVVTFSGIYRKPYWWQFWRWLEKLPVVQQFVVTQAGYRRFTGIDRAP